MYRQPSRATSLRAQLIRGSINSLFVNMLRAGLAFILAITMARLMGPSEYGAYSFGLAVIMLVAIPAQVGVPQLIVRETAKAQLGNDWPLMKGLWKWGNTTVIRFSVFGLFAAIAVLCGLMAMSINSGRLTVLTTGAVLIPLIALIAVRGACLRGLRMVITGQLPDGIIRPLILLVLIVSYVYIPEFQDVYTAERVMGMHVFAAGFTLFFASVMLSRVKPKALNENIDTHYEELAWNKAVIPLAMITGLHLVNNYADLIVLGLFRTDRELGIYRALFQVALLVVFGLQAVNQVLHPYFARLYKEGDMERLQKMVTTSARAIFILALPPALIFIFFGGPLLEWIFGPSYRIGAPALSILVVGQLVSASFGSVGALLNMTGHERDTVYGLSLSIIVNIALNFILIPRWGMVGAALATASSLLVWNFVLHRFVWKRLAIESSALGYWKRKN